MPTRLISAMIVILSSGGVAFADSADEGARLAESCTSCHGGAGRGGDTIPALAGQDENALKARMHALAAGDPDATIMPRLLRDYDDAEIAALAHYFAQVKP